MVKGILVMVLAFFAAGCMKHQSETTIYKVPEELSPFIDNFISEAAKRGYTIQKKNLIIEYTMGNDGALCGSCNSTSLDPGLQKIITIYNVNPCWFNDQQLETLIFHELGHCILGRVHVMDTLPNGNPKSIMVPDNLSLYSPCLYPIGNQPCDNSYKRPYYLNELFNMHDPAPGWSQ
ncbi:MAG: hypothetical protein ACHQEM_04760 [Chitinophagales bacterium]